MSKLAIKIQKVKEEDIKQFTKEQWALVNKEFGMEPWETFFFAAYKDWRLVGFTKIELRGDVAELRQILVHKDFRKQGIGEKLLKHFESLARKNNCRKVVLRVPDAYKEAIKFYKNREYKIEATLKNFYFGFNWYYMSKVL